VFQYAAQTLQHPAFSPGVYISVAGHSAGSESAGLQESSDSECQCHPPDGNQKGFLVPSTAISALLHPSLTTSLRHSPAFIGCARLSAFKLAMLIFRSLHGLAQSTLPGGRPSPCPGHVQQASTSSCADASTEANETATCD